MTLRWNFVPLAATLLVSSPGCSPFSKVVDEQDAGGGICRSVTSPVRPHLAGSSGGFDFVTAIRKVDMGDHTVNGQPAFLQIGFDLDGKCSGAGELNRCTTPDGVDEQIDGPGGIDNAVGGELFLGQQTMRGFASEGVNSTAEIGLLTMLIGVRDYNGTSVDNQVQVAIYAGTRVSKYETRPAAPDWLGEDQWNVFESHLLDAGAADAELDAGSDDAVPAASDARAEDYAPKYVDRQAFVTDHELVAHFPELLTIAGVLTRVTMVATVTQGELGWELGDGTFAGRIHVNSLLAVVRNENEDDGGAPICIGAPSYELRKKRLCAIADVSFEGYDDPSAACNAASWAWKFDAAPALLGRVAPLSLIPPSPCPRATDPENDRCAND